MTNEFSFKELYEVSLKATYSIEVSGETIEPNETIAIFDSIQIANFDEIRSTASARGGFDNRSYIIWDSTKEVKISLTQGVFSKTHYALMSNLNLIESETDEAIVLNARETCESNEAGAIYTKHNPQAPIFIYDANTGKKIKDWRIVDNVIYLNEQYREVIVDYCYSYANNYAVMTVGKALTSGFLSFTGKMRVKDDTTGKVVTGIVKIPKLRLMSDLSMRVGSDAIPQVGRLDAVAVPEGSRGQSKVMEIIFLSDDIDTDM